MVANLDNECMSGDDYEHRVVGPFSVFRAFDEPDGYEHTVENHPPLSGRDAHLSRHTEALPDGGDLAGAPLDGLQEYMSRPC